MLVYRLCSAKYTTLDGEGSRLYGGRWNSPGRAIVYTAESVSLAILETRVHLKAMPEDYVLLTIQIGDDYHQLPLKEPAWRVDRAVAKSLGDQHFDAAPLKPLKVPSVIASQDFNFLFTAEYAQANATILSSDPVWLDPRLWFEATPKQ